MTPTEALHARSAGLDTLAADQVLGILAEAQIEAASAVRGAVPEIAGASSIVAASLGSGGRLAYAAAGITYWTAVAFGLG